jgi:hypothetical protein
MLIRWALPIAVVLLSTTGIAQDRVRLQFQITKNDAAVASPQISLADGGHGTIGLPGLADIGFDIARTDPDRVAVNLEIKSGDKVLTPRILLVESQPGSVSWTVGQEAVSLRVWVR